MNNLNKLSYINNVGEEPLCPLTVGLLLQKACDQYGNRAALISCHQNISLTFPEILEKADRLAASFRKLDLRRGDRIGIWIPNLVEWYITKMACARGGYIAVGLNPAAESPEIKYFINKVGIKAIVTADQFRNHDYYETLLQVDPCIAKSEAGKLNSSIVPSLKHIIIISNFDKKGSYKFQNVLYFADQSDIEYIKELQKHISTDTPLNIQFTSGTTGLSKGTVLTHSNLVNNGFQVGKRNELGLKNHKICLQVPFFHAIGTVCGVIAAMHYGSTLVLPADGYNPDKNLEAIVSEKCSIIYGTPTMYIDLIHKQIEKQYDLSSVEIAVSGGAVCAPDLFKDMLKVLEVKKIKTVYGLTETTAVAFQSLIQENIELSTNTVGHVGEHLEVKVIDNNGEIVPFGIPGELCVKGYNIMKEYWNDETKTKDTVTSDGWLKTGDKFILFENGYGNVVGRLKDVIIRGGENIFPKEIEDCLYAHAKIIEVSVIGLPHSRFGEEVCACIRLQPKETISLEDVRLFCKGKLSAFKIPSQIFVVDQFPRTPVGKIQKNKLLKLVQSKKLK